MRKVVLLLLVFSLVGASAAFAFSGTDVLLSLPVMGKIAAPLAYALQGIPTVLNDPTALIPMGVLLGLWTVPNSFLLYNIYVNNGEATRMWRNVTVVTDGAAALSVLGAGIYAVAAPSQDPEGWNVLIGAIFIALSLPMLGAFGLDFIPYSTERAHP